MQNAPQNVKGANLNEHALNKLFFFVANSSTLARIIVLITIELERDILKIKGIDFIKTEILLN